MNQDYENQLARLFKIDTFRINEATPLTTYTDAVVVFGSLNTVRGQIINADIAANTETSGYTVQKGIYRGQVEGLGYTVGAALAAKYQKIPDYVMRDKFDFPKTHYSDASEETLIRFGLEVYNTAFPIKTTLTTGGMTGSTVDDLGTALTNFQSWLSKQSIAEGSGRAANVLLDTLIAQERTLINTDLRLYMGPCQNLNPTLWVKYTDAIAIDDQHGQGTPTVQGSAAPGAHSIYIIPLYHPTSRIVFSNNGTTNVFVSLSTAANLEGPNLINSLAGVTFTRQLQNLSPSGTFVIVNNPHTAPVDFKLWLVE